MLDFIYNGQGYGDVASTLLRYNFDTGSLRPFVAEDEMTYINVNRNGIAVPQMIHNAPTTLRRDDWKLIDEAVIRVAQPRLQAFGDLRAAGLEFNIPNGLSKISLEYETMSDITGATISMSPARISEFDRPQFDWRSLPLPIIHKDFQYDIRQLEISRNGRTPLDTGTAELAARRVAEEVEKLTLGVTPSYTYAGGTVYGYTNFPNRITKADMTLPTAVGWTGKTLLNEILELRDLASAKFFYGPWVLYFSPAWDAFLDNDYSDTKGDNTLRDRLGAISRIASIRTLEFLTGYQVIMVQMQSDTARAVVGMEVQTLRWEQQGGMIVNFKVMCIMVPQLRADYNGNAAIIHGTAA